MGEGMGKGEGLIVGIQGGNGGKKEKWKRDGMGAGNVVIWWYILVWEREDFMEKKNTILVVGQAKPSREDAIYNLHGEFYISLVVDRETGEILEFDCNTILGVTSRFVESIFVGKSIRTDLAVLEREIRTRYFALTQKPLIACMKDAYNRYMMAVGEKASRMP